MYEWRHTVWVGHCHYLISATCSLDVHLLETPACVKFSVSSLICYEFYTYM